MGLHWTVPPRITCSGGVGLVNKGAGLRQLLEPAKLLTAARQNAWHLNVASFV